MVRPEAYMDWQVISVEVKPVERRVCSDPPDGRYVLKATNPEYPDYNADEGMRTLARLKAILQEDEIHFA